MHKYILVVVLTIVAGCTGRDAQTAEKSSQPKDTVYTQQVAMAVYDYDPARALRMIDSAVIVGNLSEVRADVERARVYSMTQMKAQMDSLLGGPEGTSLDSGRVIGERLLGHDSLKLHLNLRQQLLEILVYTARMQKDTLKWLQRSRELADVCRMEETERQWAGERSPGMAEALRTEAELGAALCYAGQAEQGMAMLDSVIAVLSTMPSPKFNELDAFIIACKRKIGVLSSTRRYVETIPLARRIIERLEDYEAHPDRYADDTKRVPSDSTSRADYVNYYRTQAQGYISAAYTALGEHSNMTDAYLQIERSVKEAAAREHQARYRALEQQLQRQEAEAHAEREQARADNIRQQAVFFFVLLVVAVAFSIVLYRKNRDIRQKNRVLAQQLLELYDNTRPEQTQQTHPRPLPVREGSSYLQDGNFSEELEPVAEELTSPLPLREGPGVGLPGVGLEESLYRHIRDEVTRLQLYTDPGFGRQSVIERFHLTKDQAGRVFSQGSEHGSISSFITDCRLDHARRLLVSRPDMGIGEIAAASGFGVPKSFTRSFKARYGLTPTEFREQPIDE